MTTELTKSPIDAEALNQVLLGGDLSLLTATQKVQYYNRVCELVGLNPLTKPFDFIELNRKLVLYANKGCAEQLRMIHKISIKIVDRSKIGDLYVITAEASGRDGRVDSSTGAVSLGRLTGESLANAMMKAETKAKRRVTLSICGLNMLDESEVADIPPASIHSNQPTGNDGIITPKTVNVISKGVGGGKAQRHVGELSKEELIAVKELYENSEEPLSLEKQQELDRINEMFTTASQMEPEIHEEMPTAIVVKNEILCDCGKSLVFSPKKLSYYCPDFANKKTKHIRPIPQDAYEGDVK